MKRFECSEVEFNAIIRNFPYEFTISFHFPKFITGRVIPERYHFNSVGISLFPRRKCLIMSVWAQVDFKCCFRRQDPWSPLYGFVQDRFENLVLPLSELYFFVEIFLKSLSFHNICMNQISFFNPFLKLFPELVGFLGIDFICVALRE